MSPLVARLHAALPQTQCTRCGYPDCEGYAQAIASGEAPINQCPPGGAEGIARLAALTGAALLPLNPANGVEGPRSVAVIDEDWCIGCTLCFDVCPTDAVVGGNKLMHTIIEPHCTGCELCVPVCPVDCISMENVTGDRTGWQAWTGAQALEALARYTARNARRERTAVESEEKNEAEARAKLANLERQMHGARDGQGAKVAPDTDAERKRAVIEAALARARARR